MNEGWICPRCGRVNAPFTPYCDCKATVSSNFSGCNHNWVLTTVTDTTNEYKCINCGEIKIEEHSYNDGLMTTR